jgi:hypothetical protein
MSKTKWYAIGGAVLALVIFAAMIWGLYSLGGSDQSSLERFRDVAVIFIVFLSLICVILLAGITAALIFLTFQIKDRVIPLLEEVTGTAQRIRGTTEFMTEEAVKPFLAVAGNYAKVRGTMSAFMRGSKKSGPKL